MFQLTMTISMNQKCNTVMTINFIIQYYSSLNILLYIMGNSYEGVAESMQLRAKQNTQSQLKKCMQVAEKIRLTDSQAQTISFLKVSQLIQKLNSKELTSLQIVLSLILRTSKIGSKLCFYTQTNFEYAIEQAIKCDQIRKSTQKSNWTFKDGKFNKDKFLPPLFGIPISIKDTYDMKGFSSTMGLLSRVEAKHEDSPIIHCFKNLGMIPFVRTNVPQLGMNFQSVNSIWGKSLNPWNQERTTGGSSGGQAGLISSSCSVLGFGTDIGGSARIPAQFCGIFGFKTYSKRYAGSYHTKLSKAFLGSVTSIPVCVGPFSKSAEDIAYFMKSTLISDYYGQSYDPYIKICEFNDQSYLKFKNLDKDLTHRLRIGVFKSLKDIEPSLASKRALRQIEQIILTLGHECVEITVPNEQQIIREFFKQNLGTGAQTFRQILAGQKPIHQYNSLFRIAEMSAPVRGVADQISDMLMPRMHYYFMENNKRLSAYEYQTHLGAMQIYRQNWIKYWRKQGLDFVITPGFGCQAVPHGKSQKTSLAAAYTFIWNILDMSVGTMPVTVVKQSEQHYQTVYDDMISKQLKQIALNSVGLPVGVQVIGMPYEEEKVLGFMSLLESKIDFYTKHPLPKLH